MVSCEYQNRCIPHSRTLSRKFERLRIYLASFADAVKKSGRAVQGLKANVELLMLRNMNARTPVGARGRRTCCGAMAAGSVRETSLRDHLALAACRSNAGSTAILGELFIVASLSWFLREAGFGDEPDSFYHDVQGALERCVALTVSNETWSIESVDEAILAGLLCFYDQQFATAPVYVMDGARKRMQRLAKGEWLFPWPGRG